MSLLKSSATNAFYTLISRILGFVRDMIFAALLGASPIADAFYLAFRFPNYFRQLFAEGAFNAAFVPKFSQMLAKQGTKEALVFAEQTMSVLLTILICFTLVVELFMPYVLMVLAPGFVDDASTFELAVYFARWMFPYLIFMSLVALYGGILNSVGKFAAAASAPILMNICFIFGMIAFKDMSQTAGHAAMAGVVMAGIVQYLWMAGAAKYSGMYLKLRKPKMTKDIKALLKLILPAAMASGVLQINSLISNTLASFSVSGAISYLWYADRLVQLPVGVIGIAIGTALLPMMAKHLGEKNDAASNRAQNRAIELVLFLTLPAAVALIVAALPIVHILFERGAFNHEDTLNTVRTLQASAIGLPGFVLARVLTPGFFARSDTKTPFRISLIVFVTNIAVALSLLPKFGFVGIAFATAVAAWVNTILLAAILWKRKHLIIEPVLKRKIARIFISAGLLALFLSQYEARLESYLYRETTAHQIMAMAGMVVFGMIFYFATTMLIGGVDRDDLKSLFKRTLKVGKK